MILEYKKIKLSVYLFLLVIIFLFDGCEKKELLEEETYLHFNNHTRSYDGRFVGKNCVFKVKTNYQTNRTYTLVETKNKENYFFVIDDGMTGAVLSTNKQYLHLLLVNKGIYLLTLNERCEVLNKKIIVADRNNLPIDFLPNLVKFQDRILILTCEIVNESVFPRIYEYIQDNNEICLLFELPYNSKNVRWWQEFDISYQSKETLLLMLQTQIWSSKKHRCELEETYYIISSDFELIVVAAD